MSPLAPDRWTIAPRTYAAALGSPLTTTSPGLPAKREASRSPEPRPQRHFSPVLTAAEDRSAGHAAIQAGFAFHAAVKAAASALPEGQRSAFEVAMGRFCLAPERGQRSADIELLRLALRAPSEARLTLLTQADRYLSSRSNAALRGQVFQALLDLQQNIDLAAVVAVGDALAPVARAEQRRDVLLALRNWVPRAHLLGFLRAAETLLQDGCDEDAKRVIVAAQLCAGPVEPRGKTTKELKEAELAALAAGQPVVPVAAPPTTEADRQIILAAMRGAELDPCDDRYQEADGGAVPAWRTQPENVQARGRIAAVKAAWAYLRNKYPSVLPTAAVFALADAAYQQLQRRAHRGEGPFAKDVSASLEPYIKSGNGDEQNPWNSAKQLMERRWPATFTGAEALRNVWRGKGSSRMQAIALGASMAHLLDETGVTSRTFVATVWWAIHAERPSRLRDRALAASERDNMRYGFWRACMDNNLLVLRHSGEATLTRLCPNGLAQRVLGSMEGYETFRINKVTPEQLLVLLAEVFTTPLADDAEPSETALATFYAESLESSLHNLELDDREVFDLHLREYMTFEWGETARNAIESASLAMVGQATNTKGKAVVR